ncbi:MULTISPECIES: hypothetical protein [Acinetobacter]|uniref:hypothetical protein n=1 Tax=Acinetobacter TaxID=469 RepID=UPI0002AEC676|nr:MULTISPECIES: hypothetical protein [Acinetobacter]ELW89650.1 hypothetical protein ACINWC743_3884 [Acinetobacter sp. WC-743]MBJ8426142.1 hypothetical protein [Acinetobacter bereziniae]MBJ8450799.1 hypothetical protein [Acinetobacter bereziniae]MBJ8454897.1 hypothetical protein [Acinetobacter bereziniae]MBJ8475130.1 hypothetical protein [Acinetobacter bereziniae]
MVAPIVAAAYVVIAFLLRVLLHVLKKLLNQAAKVSTELVKKYLAPFLKDIGATIAQELIEFIFSFATEVATDIKREQRASTTPKPSGSTKPTAPSQASRVGAWYEVYTKKPILFKSVICKVCCFSNQIGGATGKASKKETIADKVINLWGGLRHLRQKAVQVIFALVDIVMEHKCPIKAEVIYDKKTKQPLMVTGANPPRHKFMETPGSGRWGADIVVVKNMMKAPTLDNILHWVEIKFIDSQDAPDREQMTDYARFLGGSTMLAMIRISADPKKSDCGCKAKAVPQNTHKPSSTPQGKKTSKVNKMREIWDVVVTNAENLWK